MKITVVVPVMNERPTLERLVQDVIEHIAPHRYRIIFVDDGSTDGSWDEMARLVKAYPHVEAIRFPQNFGKTPALDAAFREADGDLVLMMDADLQDDPKEIPRLLDKLEEGFDMVCGWKATRHLIGPGGAYVTTLPSVGLARDLLWSRLAGQRAAIVIVKPVAADVALLAQWLAEGLQVPIDSTVPVKDVKKGILHQQQGQVRGRISVQVLGGFD